MDLRKDFPRSMRATAGGYAHLARMIDKCRAVLAGTQGEYIYPCPLDRRLLDFVGITSDQFTAAVRSHQSDEAVVAWFREVATPRSIGELEEWNKALWPADPVLLRALSDSGMIEMPLTPREPILLRGQIFKIWRKDANAATIGNPIVPPAPELRYGETGSVTVGGLRRQISANQ
jgi:hypothetical protein